MTGTDDRSCAIVPPHDAAVTTTPTDGDGSAESADWLLRLRSSGSERDEAVRELRALLLGAARWQLRRVGRRGMSAGELEALAGQAANDATVAVLRRLGDFEGRSRFSTWVYKFGLLHASVIARREAWREREIPTEPENWPYYPDPAPAPDQEAEAVVLAEVLRTAIATSLTPHQRDVLIALAVNDVPVDVVADRLGSTRGALYKTLHDARNRLRDELREHGIEPPAARRKGTAP